MSLTAFEAVARPTPRSIEIININEDNIHLGMTGPAVVLDDLALVAHGDHDLGVRGTLLDDMGQYRGVLEGQECLM